MNTELLAKLDEVRALYDTAIVSDSAAPTPLRAYLKLYYVYHNLGLNGFSHDTSFAWKLKEYLAPIEFPTCISEETLSKELPHRFVAEDIFFLARVLRPEGMSFERAKRIIFWEIYYEIYPNILGIYP